MKIAINGSAYPLLKTTEWHGTERMIAGLSERLPAEIVEDFGDRYFDTVVACEKPDQLLFSRAKKRLFMTSMSHFAEEGLEAIETAIFTSEFHKKYALQNNARRLDETKCRVISYATDIAPSADFAKIPGRLLWGSSPDRGLHHALRIFKKAKKRMPDLSFEVTYSIQAVKARRWEHSQWGVRWLEMESLLDQDGVILRGHIGREEMLTSIQQAEILLYPLDPIAPTELFGLIVLECMASGTIPLLSEADCFASLWGGDAPILEIPIKDDVWVDAIAWLRDPKVASEWQSKGLARAKQHSWEAILPKWREVLDADL